MDRLGSVCRRLARWVLPLTLLCGGVELASLALAQSSYEAHPVLRASDLAPPTMLKGPRFAVDEAVSIPNLLPRFIIRSDFGVFEAYGRDMPGTRVVEIGALEAREDEQERGIRPGGGQCARPARAVGD